MKNKDYGRTVNILMADPCRKRAGKTSAKRYSQQEEENAVIDDTAPFCGHRHPTIPFGGEDPSALY